MSSADKRQTLILLKRIHDDSVALMQRLNTVTPKTNEAGEAADSSQVCDVISKYAHQYYLAPHSWHSSTLSQIEKDLIYELMRHQYKPEDFTAYGYELTAAWETVRHRFMEAIIDRNMHNRPQLFWSKQINLLFKNWNQTLRKVSENLHETERDDFLKFICELEKRLSGLDEEKIKVKVKIYK